MIDMDRAFLPAGYAIATCSWCSFLTLQSWPIARKQEAP